VHICAWEMLGQACLGGEGQPRQRHYAAGRAPFAPRRQRSTASPAVRSTRACRPDIMLESAMQNEEGQWWPLRIGSWADGQIRQAAFLSLRPCNRFACRTSVDHAATLPDRKRILPVSVIVYIISLHPAVCMPPSVL